MNPQLICDGDTGRAVAYIIDAVDSAIPANRWPAHGIATINAYTSAFFAQVGANAFQVKSKITKKVGDPTTTVTIIMNASDDASGLSLPPLSLSVDLVPPVAPAQKAITLVIASGPSVITGSPATDPGFASIPVTL